LGDDEKTRARFLSLSLLFPLLSLAPFSFLLFSLSSKKVGEGGVEEGKGGEGVGEADEGLWLG
jgi:hypothetical protein